MQERSRKEWAINISRWTVEFLFLLTIWLVYAHLIHWKTWDSELLFRPNPDAVEYAYVAHALAQGESPLLPVAGELHPSRYAVVHPAMMAGWLSLPINDDQDDIYRYPRAVLFFAFLAVWGVLYFVGFHWISRVIIFYLLFLSPVLVGIGRGLMSESSVFLLLNLGMLAWLAALKWEFDADNESPRRKYTRWTLYALAGFFVAQTIAMRGTFIVLVILPVIQLLIHFPWRRTIAPVLLFGGGLLAGLLPSFVYSAVVAGEWSLTHYTHWVGDTPLFQLNQLWLPPDGMPNQGPMLWLILESLFGRNVNLTLSTPPIFLLLFLGGVVALFIPSQDGWRKDLQKSTLLLLLLFITSHIVLFSPFRWYAPRFFVGAFPAIVLFGILGWQRSMSRLVNSLSRGPALTMKVFFAALIVLCILEPPTIKFRLNYFRELLGSEEGSEHVRDHIDNLREAGDIIRGLRGPVFIDGFSVLAVRIWWNMIGEARPLALIQHRNSLHRDGHFAQHNWYNVGDPIAYVSDSPASQRHPRETWLVHPDRETLNKSYLEELTSGGERAFVLCYPIAYHNNAVPVLEWCDTQNVPRPQLNAPGNLVIYAPGHERPRDAELGAD